MKMDNENELELGKYLESDMIELTNDEVAGGGTPLVVLSVISAYISNNTCPSTVCTRAC
ncbi:Lantibiotic lacticin 3147 A2 precursor [Clostridium putrefaciens]|uniref:Lantibiotic lacticin 3147 A2 n=1 Tax=Clostridium putrefaciens TaxID=99675 RepID=A0A381JDM8_9CLOT|nr:class II lanthipeptide, LchA2/BrtA2 family [Clostridium putrefaciens]SUY48507.1 Lantibiotic lacticin 3147 A2 precursor [Clostridium putrefaciens]